MKSDQHSRRGRPVGSSPNAVEDDKLLAHVALQLTLGSVADFTNAAKRILGSAPTAESALKRLQKKWKSRRGVLLEEAAKIQKGMRSKIDERALRVNQPELHEIADAFARSEKGQLLLRARGIQPDQYMSLGMVELWKVISAASAVGSSQADRFFDEAYNGWASIGLEPDEDFLLRVAARATEKARELSDRRVVALLAQKNDQQ